MILAIFVPAYSAKGADGQIIIGQNAPEFERYAAGELQRYLYQLSGSFLTINSDTAEIDCRSFVIGTKESNALIGQFAEAGILTMDAKDPGPQGYILKRFAERGHNVIAIAGGDAIGSLYGVYGLLDDHYKVGFYLSGDVMPEAKKQLELPAVDECKTPAMYIRGILPWTNFHQSATVFSWEDWKFVLDQMAKMRMNFIHIHNYNKTQGHYPRSYTENNEMFHSFSYRGYTQRPWFSTASTGHCWTVQGWDVNKYRFGAADLFDDYDFGSEATLYNETLSDQAVIHKGSSMFQKVIAYAHSRGIRVGLGLDIDMIPYEYGVSANDPEIIQSRLDQIVNDYPDLDYLLCFQSEKHSAWTSDEYKQWRYIFNELYKGIKERSENTKLAVSGWGLNPESIKELPSDVICAPIAKYGSKFENGDIYGDREYWGCPWLETDGGCSQHYYPYNVHLSDTMQSYQKRAPNMKGLYCLTWRISDAIEPKLSYIAKAPWDSENKYNKSYDIYKEYAVKNYGPKAAEDITAIINENEPFAEDHGECRHTPEFTGTDRHAKTGRIIGVSTGQFYDDAQKPLMKLPLYKYSGKYGNTRVQSSKYKEGKYVWNIASANWLRYDKVDFDDTMTEFKIRAIGLSDSEIEVRLDKLNGSLLGVFDIKKSENFQSYKTKISKTKGQHTLYLKFLLKEKKDYAKTAEQLEVIDRAIDQSNDQGAKYRLELLRCRIDAVRDYLDIDKDFPSITWDDMPGAFDRWMKNFTGRIYDISSLGNIISVQNRFVKQRYVAKNEEFRKSQVIKSPSFVEARGTQDGAVISWRNEQPEVKGFHIYRNDSRITNDLLPPEITAFANKGNGLFEYRVSAVGADGQESPQSVPTHCKAGASDTDSPQMIVISPPTSSPLGQSVDVELRVLDDRTFSSISAKIFYRKPTDQQWKQFPMQRKTKAVFGYRIPGKEVNEEGLQYYLVASDGDNISYFPTTAPALPMSLTACRITDTTAPAAPSKAPTRRLKDKTIRWARPSSDDVFWYQIYRSSHKDFEPGPANRLTYIPGYLTEFKDNGLDWNGQRLNGLRYYKVTALDKSGNESSSDHAIAVDW